MTKMTKCTLKIFYVLVWIQAASVSTVFSRLSVYKCGNDSNVILSTVYEAHGAPSASCGAQGNVEPACRKNMYAPIGKCSNDGQLSVRVVRCTGNCNTIVDALTNAAGQMFNHSVDYSDGATLKRVIVDTGKLRLVSQIVVEFNWTLAGPMKFTMSYGLDGKNWIDYTTKKLVKTFECERSGASTCLISGRKVFTRYLRFNFASLAQWNQGDLTSGNINIFASPDTVYPDPNSESVTVNDTGRELGCYVEDPSSRYMLVSSGLTGYALQDQWGCMARCNHLGARFAAIEAGIQCNCGYVASHHGKASGKSSCVLPYYGSAGTQLDHSYGKPGLRVYRLPSNISAVSVTFPSPPPKLGQVFYVSATMPSDTARVQLTVDFGDGQRPIVTCSDTVGYRFINPGQYLVKVRVEGYSGMVVTKQKNLVVNVPPEGSGLKCPSIWPTGVPASCVVTQARGVNVTGTLTIQGVTIPLNISDATPYRVGEDANIVSPSENTTEFADTRIHILPLAKVTAKGYLQSTEYYVVKPGPIRINILRPSHPILKDEDVIKCTGSSVFVLDKCSCCPRNNDPCTTPGVQATPVNYTIVYDLILAHTNSIGYHVVEISNLTGVKVVPGDIIGWTASNITGKIATISTTSSVQGWTVDLPANDVKVGAIFDSASNMKTTNSKYALSVYIIAEPEVTVNYTFNSPGTHHASLLLRNSHDSASQSQNILVQHAITDLKLIVPECVLSRRNHVFTVNMTRGTNVTFTWNFGEGNNLTINQETVNYQYNNSGSYTVKLVAFNKVTAVLIQCQHIEVLHAVEDLTLRRLQPTAVNQMLAIGCSLGGGSKVNISFSISDGYRFDNITNLSVVSLFVLAKNHTFTQPGIYHVSVFAVNKLTSALATTDIIIQTPISGLKIEPLPTYHNGDRNLTLRLSVTAGTNVSYYVTINGANITGQWLTANGSTAEATIQPHVFPEAGILDINATAYNLVTAPIVVNVQVEVEFPVGDLRLSTSESAVRVNKSLTVDVTVGRGSNAFVMLTLNGTKSLSRSCCNIRNFSSEISFINPGVYVIQLSVNNSWSSVTLSKTLIVQVPCEQLIVTTNSPRPIAPYMVTFNLTLPVGAKQPTDATVVWKYGDGGNSTKKPFVSHSTEKHGYAKVGVYTAIVNVTNLVSSFQKHLTIEVQERITRMEATLTRSTADPQTGQPGGGPDKNYFPLDYDVTFTITAHDGTNVMFLWNYGDGSVSDVTNSSMLTRKHRFASSGPFTITLTASNVLGSCTVTLPLFLERSVLGLKVSDDSPRMLKQNTTFELTMTQFGTDTAIEIDLGDGTKMVYGTKAREKDFSGSNFTTVNNSTKSITIVHFYAAPQQYLVNILAHNKASHVTLKYKSVLLFKQCKYPVVEIIGLGATPAKCMITTRSRQFIIYTNNHIDCQASRQTVFKWKVCKYNGPNTNGTVLNISTTFSNSDLSMPKRSLALGINEVTFTVKMAGVAGVETTAQGYICVDKSPLVAGIAGGSGRSEGYDKIVTIDGTPSEDPDAGPGVHKNMTFTWLCRKVNESFPLNVTEMSPVSLGFSGNASRGGCYGTGLGPLNVSTPSFKLYTGDLELTDYVFELRIRKGDRRAVFSQRLKVVAGDPPSLSITCIVNCQAKTSSREKLSVEGKCTNYGPEARLLYKWELFERSSSDEKWRPILDERFKTSTGRSSKNLVVSPYVITPGMFCMLKYSAWISGGPKGYVEYQFSANLPPLNGSCTVSSSNGVALKTYFTVTCPSWVDPDLPLFYKFSYKIGSYNNLENLLYVGSQISTPLFTLPVGPASKNFTFEITAQINDVYGSYTEVSLKVRVTEPQMTSADLQSLTSGNGSIADKVLAGDTQAAAQLITAVCSVLNTRAADQTTSNNTVAPGGRVLTDEEKKKQEAEAAKVKAAATKARTGIILILNNIKAETLEELQQQSNALSAATQQKDEVNEEATHAAIQIISDMSLTLREKSRTAGTKQMEKTCAGVVASIGSIMGVASFGIKKKLTDLETLKKEENIMEKEVQENSSEQPISEEEKKKKEQELKRKKEETKNMTTRAIKSLDIVASVLLEALVPGEEEKVIETVVLTLAVSNEFPAEIGTKPFVCQGGVMKVPPYEILFSGQNSTTDCTISRKSMNAPENPFSWDESASTVTSNALGLDFVNCTGHEMRVTNLDTTINITIPSSKSSASSQPAEFQTDSETIMMHSIEVFDNETAIHVEIHPVNCTGRRLKVFLRKNFRPTEEKFDHNWTLPIIDFHQEGNESVLVQSNAFFLSNVQLNNTAAGKFYLGVLADAHDNKSAECPLVNYTLVTFTSSCLYWDESVDMWKGDGCEVGPKTNQNFTECRCTHLTTFGGGFFVAPNPIDFSKAIQGFANLSENPAVFACVMSIYGLYLLLVIWTRWRDKKDLEKIGVSPLPDNDPRDDYAYEITVQTGWQSGAGTTADVYIQLTGALGESDPRNVKDPKRPKFKRAAVDQFLLTVPQSLGDLRELHIWHNNAGDSPSWYLFRVLIRDMQSSQRWWFVCDKWLAVEEDDGQVERRLPVASKKDLTQFNILFANATRKNLLDGHIWFSVFTRPPRSTFTRTQRLSCCLSLMLTTMLANAMFYQTGGSSKNNTVHIGPFSLSMTQVLIGIESSLVVFPVNLLLVTIFRKLKAKEPRSKKYEKEDDLVVTTTGRATSSYGGRNSREMSVESPRKRKPSSTEELVEIKTKTGFNLRKVLGFFKDDNDSSKNKKKFLFPHWCIYIAYGLVFMSSLVSGFFCCLYGFQFGKEKSEQWLSSMMISFWQSVIVIQPFKVFLIAAFIALIVKDPEKEEDDDGSAELKEDEQFPQGEKNADDEAALKMIGFYNKPPDCEKLEKARQLRLKQREMKSIIKEICNHMLIIIVVLFVAYANHDTQSYSFSKEVTDIFIKGKISRYPLSKVDRSLDYWIWMAYTVIPGLYPPDIQKGYKYTGVMTNSLTTNLLGAARIRQLRVQKDSCLVPEVFSTTVETCNDEYSWTKDETRDFKEGWVPVKPTNDSANPTSSKPTKPKSPWEYQGQWESKGFPYFGRLATYKGGGYIFEVGPDAKGALEIVKKLRKTRWLDETTRGLFTEINVYNANVNLLCVITLLYEQTPTGGSMHFINIQTIKIFRYVGGFSTAILFFEIIFLVLLFTWMYRDAKKIKREKKAFFRNAWNVVDLAITLLSITAMGLYFSRLVFINVAVGQFRKDRTSFVSFQYVVLLNEILNSMIAIAVLLLNLKFLRILRFNRKISLLSSTMRACIKSLFYFVIMFMIIFLSYCIVSYLVFGTQVAGFRTFIRSIVSMFSMMLGNFNFNDMEEAQRVIGPALFFSYMVVIQMVLINMFIGILCETFSAVRHDSNKQSNEHEIVQFMTNRFKAFVGKMVEPAIRPDYKFPKSELEQNVEYIDERADTAMYYMRNLCCEDLRHANWFETQDQKKMQVVTLLMDTQLEFYENDICDGITEMMKVMEKYSEAELDKILIAARKKRDLMEACLPSNETATYDSENDSASEVDDNSDLEETLEGDGEEEEEEVSSDVLKGRKTKLSLVEEDAFEEVEKLVDQSNYSTGDVSNILFPGRDNKGLTDEIIRQPVGKASNQTNRKRR